MALRHLGDRSGNARRLRSALCGVRAMPLAAEAASRYRHWADGVGIGLDDRVSAGLWGDSALPTEPCLLARDRRARWIPAVDAALAAGSDRDSCAIGGEGCSFDRSSHRAGQAA